VPEVIDCRSGHASVSAVSSPYIASACEAGRRFSGGYLARLSHASGLPAADQPSFTSCLSPSTSTPVVPPALQPNWTQSTASCRAAGRVLPSLIAGRSKAGSPAARHAADGPLGG